MNSRARVVFAAAIVLLTANPRLRAEPALSSKVEPVPVLDAMRRVADWQLAHPSAYETTDWTQGAGAAGIMALAGISADEKYRRAMVALGEENHWQLGPDMYVADDHCIGQTYAELYLLYRNPKMIAPLRARFDAILARPATAASLDATAPNNWELWSWADSLFMAPATWARLYAATGDKRYLDFVLTNWWRTADYLYDKRERLFFRDSTFFNKREPNGKKVYWGRGNGWVLAGLVRVLQDVPANHPARGRFERLLKEMSERILLCQQPDGLWRASLLDP
jgi:rhamnogalacturonyl hydrolase YesR